MSPLIGLSNFSLCLVELKLPELTNLVAAVVQEGEGR